MRLLFLGSDFEIHETAREFRDASTAENFIGKTQRFPGAQMTADSKCGRVGVLAMAFWAPGSSAAQEGRPCRKCFPVPR